eukprot:PhM_4_TR16014/c0_g1_i1/m.82693
MTSLAMTATATHATTHKTAEHIVTEREATATSERVPTTTTALHFILKHAVVVQVSLVRVREHAEGLLDVLKLILSRLLLILARVPPLVRVVLQRRTAVRLLDHVLAVAAGHAEDLVVVLALRGLRLALELVQLLLVAVVELNSARHVADGLVPLSELLLHAGAALVRTRAAAIQTDGAVAVIERRREVLHAHPRCRAVAQQDHGEGLVVGLEGRESGVVVLHGAVVVLRLEAVVAFNAQVLDVADAAEQRRSGTAIGVHCERLSQVVDRRLHAGRSCVEVRLGTEYQHFGRDGFLVARHELADHTHLLEGVQRQTALAPQHHERGAVRVQREQHGGAPLGAAEVLLTHELPAPSELRDARRDALRLLPDVVRRRHRGPRQRGLGL